jgi:hypothetical protein
MTEAASTSETSVNFYQTTWRDNPEDSYLLSKRVTEQSFVFRFNFPMRAAYPAHSRLFYQPNSSLKTFKIILILQNNMQQQQQQG